MLRKEMAAKAKAAGKTDVPNLQESVVEVHVHSGTKRKVELPPRPGKGKDVKKVRAALLGTGSASGAGSASGEKGPKVGLIELSEISVRKDISITLPNTIVNSIDNMDAEHIVRTMMEFGSKALVLSRRVGSLYRREVKEGWPGKSGVVAREEDYDDLKDKYDGVVGELDDLKNNIIQEHINGFEKGLRQAAFFH
ncbi:hypothetical protein DEO72_LG1g2180 [Vigna unguiculata]|uniref:Uncharacterized protein n=1 Tax=Vigna unguiculata TaxID=3917 RepID=A0A4D6KXQ1_VIGUN|nr:hypothetical protein DEO72_LG1g2180 [Vigna unguiculata]